jgi:hypothetical protein
MPRGNSTTGMKPTCRVCLEPLGVSVSCDAQRRRGVTRYGADMDAEWYRDDVVPGLPARCHDCAVAIGAVHHQGCCVAWCTACDDQRLCCPCDDDPAPL